MNCPLRYLVTGLNGQVVQALRERSHKRDDIDIIAIGRPDLELERPETIAAAVMAMRPDLIVSAAAYTAVDQAEENEAAAFAVNAQGPAELARQAALIRVPIIHLSTDYIFDGHKGSGYVEDDPVAPLSAYGRSKLEGERQVMAACDDHAILRTAWIYSPFGRNFVKTMLRLAEDRDVVNVVGDQVGNPTSAFDIADALLRVADNLLASKDAALRGVFHMAANGDTSWAEFAGEIFRFSAARGGPSARVNPIDTAAYPTPARRPSNSRLDCRKLLNRHSVKMPEWRISLEDVVARLVDVHSSK